MVADTINFVDMEIKRLKVKTNMLLDVKEHLEEENKKLRATIKKLKNRMGYKEKDAIFKIQNDIYEVEARDQLDDIFLFLCMLKDANIWLEFKYNSANEKVFYRIEKRDFDKQLDLFIQEKYDKKQFITLLAGLGVLKSTENKVVHSITANGRTRRVYMLRRSAVDYPGIHHD